MNAVKEKETGVSIIVCCYNSSARLPQTIKHLAGQTGVSAIPIEVLVIDNASTDDTFIVAEQLCAKYLTIIPYRIIVENEPGLTSARKRGINEAVHELLVFCDDDNWLNDKYVQIAYNNMLADSRVGILGSQTVGAYEVSPPAWFLEVPGVFAVGKPEATSADVTFTRGWIQGAGFIIRKSIYKELGDANYHFFLTGRKGNKLTSGEDKELCFAVRKLGYKIVYNEHLVLTHYMPAQRFDYKKLLSMAYHSGRAAYIDDLYNKPLLLKAFWLYWASAILLKTVQLLISILLMPFKKLLPLKKSIRNDQRYHHSLGYLSILLNVKYCIATRHLFKLHNLLLN